MQDGQNLFDPALSFAGSWGAKEAADATSRLGLDAILVGISNVGASRIDEYSPFTDHRVGGGRGEQYLAFVLRRVKPLVDRTFRTLGAREHTVIGGASMGGLIALYAFFRHPQVFGRVAVQSPALWFAGGGMFDYIDAVPYIPGRVFLDVGVLEGAQTLRNAQLLRERLRHKGYAEGTTLRWLEDRRGTHQEAAWGRRLKRALPFLLAPEQT
jgi:predicted alpha/beta superfamily hydrolase